MTRHNVQKWVAFLITLLSIVMTVYRVMLGPIWAVPIWVVCAIVWGRLWYLASR